MDAAAPGDTVLVKAGTYRESVTIHTNGLTLRAQGSVTLEAVVSADGTIGEVTVVKSLDKAFGLDEEAVRSAKKWLFRPGTFKGQAVDTVVTLVLDFRIH